jgi:multiple sugar transport system ATP-binding protein
MAQIALEDLSKVYADGTRAVSELDLQIEDGELMVFVGPSGCGKTTALRMVAGLEDITSGVVRIGDRVVNKLPPKDRDVAMIFQNYALYPHMSAYDNMAFGLKMRSFPKAEIRRRVDDAARVLGLEPVLKKKPRTLSGGQRQRVAMGRAIVREPQAFLMDEPLSNLDAKLRVQVRAEIHQLQRRVGVTTLYVTHDQVEAMTLGDRVAVMREGRLQQADTPQTLYDNPVNQFVAGFIGSPSINLVEAELERADGGLWVKFGEHRLPIDDKLASRHSGLEGYVGKTVMLGIRPEDFEDIALEPDTPPERRLKTICDLTEPLGSEVLVHFTVSATGAVHDAAAAEGIATDTTVEEGKTRMVARVSPRTRIAEGQPIELAVDTNRLYFFDPETTASI